MKGLRSFVLLSVVLVIALAGCTKENKAEKVGNDTTATTAAGSSSATTAKKSSGPTTYKVGDVVKLGSYQVVVHAVKNPQPPVNQFSKPPAGSHWVSADLEVTNTSTKPQQFSSLLGIEAQDAENRTYKETVTSGLTPGPPDGEISPQSSTRGFVVFEVPDTTTSLRLRFKGEVFSSGTAVIQLFP